MTGLGCLRASEWIQARNAGLPQATALRLEEHLAHCPRCSARARALERLQVLSDASAPALSHAARQRAVLRALASADHPPQLSAARRRWFVPSAAGALAAIALVSLGIGLRGELAVLHADRVVSGELDGQGGALARGAQLPANGEFATNAGAVVALAHARVELRANTRARWNAPARRLRLDEGSVVAEVDPAQHRSFSVETAAFRVEVLGTRFEVSRDRVHVLRGRVRVLSPQGASLATLGAGESFTAAPQSPQPQAAASSLQPEPQVVALAPQPRSAASPPQPGAAASPSQPQAAAQRAVASGSQPQAAALAPQPGAAEGEHAEPAAAEPEGVARREAAKPKRAGTASPDALLEQARMALGGREIERARRLVADALELSKEPRQRAEALTLRAECSLVAGDLRSAAAGYLEVAEKFPRLLAGENALFAAARIEAERERSPRGLLRYLERYPRGRFVKEANARLRELKAGSISPQP